MYWSFHVLAPDVYYTITRFKLLPVSSINRWINIYSIADGDGGGRHRLILAHHQIDTTDITKAFSSSMNVHMSIFSQSERKQDRMRLIPLSVLTPRDASHKQEDLASLQDICSSGLVKCATLFKRRARISRRWRLALLRETNASKRESIPRIRWVLALESRSHFFPSDEDRRTSSRVLARTDPILHKRGSAVLRSETRAIM